MPRPDRLPAEQRAEPRDVEGINKVFSEAFTDRYQRDGLAGVRVPPLNPAVWRFAIATAGEGAMVWRDQAKSIIAFNMVHRSGSEGWMGPLAVRPDRQGEGVGRAIVAAGIRHLTDAGARTIGLETMPRTVENIGFYSALGFRPGHLTVTMVRDLTGGGTTPATRLSRDQVETGVQSCRALAESLVSGLDFSREIRFTLEHRLGDVSLVRTGDRLAGFALWHTAPLAEGRASDELRLLKVVAGDPATFRRLVAAAEVEAWAEGAHRVGIRCQSDYAAAYGALVDSGYRVHWTDLRMALGNHSARPAGEGIVFSNWEI